MAFVSASPAARLTDVGKDDADGFFPTVAVTLRMEPHLFDAYEKPLP